MGNFSRAVEGEEFTWVAQAAPTQGIKRRSQAAALSSKSGTIYESHSSFSGSAREELTLCT